MRRILWEYRLTGLQTQSLHIGHAASQEQELSPDPGEDARWIRIGLPIALLLCIFFRMGKLFTTDGAADYLGVTAARVRQLIAEGRVRSEKYGRDHLINGDSLRDYEKNGRRGRGRPPKRNGDA